MTMMVETITKNMARQLLPVRRADSHKGSYGTVLVIAGSEGMAGAAALCAGAALRGGAGLVKVALPRKLFNVIHVCVPEAVCVNRDNITPEAIAEYDAIAIGPGLGTDENAASMVEFVIKNYSGACVMDADALNILATGKISALSDADLSRCVITPHPGEAGRLLGIGAKEVQLDRESATRVLLEKYGAVTLLKGHGTLVATADKLFVNPTGNAGMATAGSGDVLTGLIVSLLGQGLGVGNAALAGAYIHGLAGDIAATEKGQYGLIASDIKEAIPYAIKAVMN
jgi:NAD(P)H-hydrate epimerase